MWSLCVGRKSCYFSLRIISARCRLLLQQNGADVNLLDADKRSPLFYARSGSYQDIISVLLAHDCQDDAQSPLSSDTGSTELTQTAWCHVISCDVMWLVISIIILCSVHKFSIVEFTTAFLPKPCRDLCFASCIIIIWVYFYTTVIIISQTSSRQLQILFKLCLMVVMCVYIDDYQMSNERLTSGMQMRD